MKISSEIPSADHRHLKDSSDKPHLWNTCSSKDVPDLMRVGHGDGAKKALPSLTLKAAASAAELQNLRNILIN